MHESLLIFPFNMIVALGIPPFVLFSWVASLIIIVIALMAKSSLNMIPTGVQNVVEVIFEFFIDLSESTIGHMGKTFLPLLATLGLYILIGNFLGLIPGFEAPTGNINTTVALALPVFFATHYYGVKVHKLSYIKHFVGPVRSIAALPLMILMFFIELIGHLARPITLSVRLFGNMMAKHILIGVLAILAPWIIPTLILALGTLVSLIQAFVFVLLSTLYLAGSVEEAH